MEQLRLSGLATGMDTSAIIEQLMSIERRPVRMAEANKALEATRLERYRALNTKLAALQTAAQNLIGSSFTTSSLSGRVATSSNTALFTASADNTATPGTYSVNVTKLAREQKTGGGDYVGPASAGTLRITDSSNVSVSVAISAGMTASQVATAINNASAGMSASVIKDANGDDAIVLTGRQTGETYTIDDNGAGSTLVSDLGLSSTYQTAQKAEVVIDGTFTYQSNSNAITNAIPGVTINAVATGTASLAVTRDESKAVDKVKDLVAKFNDIINQIKADTKYDAATKKGGALVGDSFVSNLGTQLSRQLTEQFEALDGSHPTGFSYYNDVGIQVQRDGTLTLDEAKLKEKLAADPQKVYALFGQEDGAKRTDIYGKDVDLNTAKDGLAQRLDAFVSMNIGRASTYNDTKNAGGTRYEGSLLNRITQGEDRLKGFDDRIDAFERRLEVRERSMRARFLAMEKAVAMLRNQGNYLSGQFAQMSGGQ